MTKLPMRKLVLLLAIAVLLCVYILQLAFTGRSTVKNAELSATPDALNVQIGQDESQAVSLVQKNGNWFVGQKEYPADENSVAALLNAIKTVRLLGVSAQSAGSEADARRYGLDDESKILVQVFKDGVELRTLTVGKNTSTGSQCYVQLDGKSTVYLAGDALHTVFSTSVDSLRSKSLYSVESALIASITVASTEGTFTLQKTEAAPDLTAAASPDEQPTMSAPQTAWLLEQNGAAFSAPISSEKVESWLYTIATLRAASWDDDAQLPPEEQAAARISFAAAGKVHKINLFALYDDEERFLCSSSDSPYPFYLANATAQKFIKTPADFVDEQ